MSIVSINEIPNPTKNKLTPVEEVQNIIIPDIVDQNIPIKNGFIYLMTGAGGSGKSSLMLNMFKSKNMYRGIFDNIYYICPEASFSSVKNHPFKDHDKVYHELNIGLLDSIYEELNTKKELATTELEKKKNNKKKGKKIGGFDTSDITDEKELKEEKHEIEYSCIIIDDFANDLKNMDIQKQLNKMIIKARHICCAFIFTLQTFNYMPKVLRKQVTNMTIFKPRNVEEFILLSHELLNMSKDNALTLFNYAFDELYAHLDINTITNEYYKNFNKLEIEMKNNI
jgi:hypothetical protein